MGPPVGMTGGRVAVDENKGSFRLSVDHLLAELSRVVDDVPVPRKPRRGSDLVGETCPFRLGREGRAEVLGRGPDETVAQLEDTDVVHGSRVGVLGAASSRPTCRRRPRSSARPPELGRRPGSRAPRARSPGRGTARPTGADVIVKSSVASAASAAPSRWSMASKSCMMVVSPEPVSATTCPRFPPASADHATPARWCSAEYACAGLRPIVLKHREP